MYRLYEARTPWEPIETFVPFSIMIDVSSMTKHDKASEIRRAVPLSASIFALHHEYTAGFKVCDTVQSHRF